VLSPLSESRPQNSAVAASAATVAAEKRVLGAILIAGRLPDGPLTPDDFADARHAQIYEAMVQIAVLDKPVTAANVWEQARQLDAVQLCEIAGDFAADDTTRGWLLDAYAAEVVARGRRREELQAA
jgi:replicative DNA helicase